MSDPQRPRRPAAPSTSEPWKALPVDTEQLGFDLTPSEETLSKIRELDEVSSDVTANSMLFAVK